MTQKWFPLISVKSSSIMNEGKFHSSSIPLLHDPRHNLNTEPLCTGRQVSLGLTLKNGGSTLVSMLLSHQEESSASSWWWEMICHIEKMPQNNLFFGGGAEADLEGNWFNRSKGGTWWPWDTTAWCCSSVGRVLASGEEVLKKAWKTNKQVNIIGNWIKLLFFVETETKSSWKETKSLYVTWKLLLSIDKNLKLLSLFRLERRIGLLLLQWRATHFIH